MCRVSSCVDNLGKSKSACTESFHNADNLGCRKGSLIEVAKGVFGFPDSPRRWWREVRDTLNSKGWSSTRLDPCILFSSVKEALSKELSKCTSTTC